MEKSKKEIRAEVERALVSGKVKADVAKEIAKYARISNGEVSRVGTPHVSTIEEARQSKARWFLYPAHSVDCFLVTDLRMLEWMRQTGTPLTQSNCWEFNKCDFAEARQYVERHRSHWERRGFEPVKYDENDKVLKDCFLGGLELVQNDIGGLVHAIVYWLNMYETVIAEVNYASSLHSVWLGLVRD